MKIKIVILVLSLFVLVLSCLNYYNYSSYNNCDGKTFCEMSEKCRLENCSYLRKKFDIDVVEMYEYKCTEDGSIGILEIKNSSKTNENDLKLFMYNSQNINVLELCKNNNSTAYTYKIKEENLYKQVLKYDF